MATKVQLVARRNTNIQLKYNQSNITQLSICKVEIKH